MKIYTLSIFFVRLFEIIKPRYCIRNLVLKMEYSIAIFVFGVFVCLVLKFLLFTWLRISTSMV